MWAENELLPSPEGVRGDKQSFSMKRTFILLTVLCSIGFAQAQVGVYRSGGYGTIKSTQQTGPLTKNGKVYYYHGEPMTEAEMVAFVKKDCDKAYQHYKKNKALEVAGTTLFCTGVVMSVGMGSGFLGGAKGNKTLQTCGLAFYGAGALVGITGLPMLIVGNVRKKNTHKVYNTWCGYKELEASRPELKLTSGANGIGVALAF